MCEKGTGRFIRSRAAFILQLNQQVWASSKFIDLALLTASEGKGDSVSDNLPFAPAALLRDNRYRLLFRTKCYLLSSALAHTSATPPLAQLRFTQFYDLLLTGDLVTSWDGLSEFAVGAA